MAKGRKPVLLPMTISPKTSYYLKTFGCQMNFSDSERIASFLDSQGLDRSPESDGADLAVFNTCGVRQTAEDRVYGQVHNLRKKNPNIKIVVTGCLAHRKDVQRKLKEKVNLFVTIDDFFKLSFKNLNQISNFQFPISSRPNKNQHYLDTFPKYKNKPKISLPIMTGCNNFCSYCVVPYARGQEWSRPVEDIFQEVETAAKKGCREILLLGQNVNSYNFTGKNKIDNLKIKYCKLFENWKLQIGNFINIIDFPLLMEMLAKTYPKITFSFLTSHPKDFSDGLIEVIAKNQNISRSIHLPVQSGSDRILEAMNRRYTQKHYLDIIKKIKDTIPDVKLSTDVIVGFPGETESDFQETQKVFRQAGFEEAFINKYSPRPGTAAFELGDPISWGEKKRREKLLRSML